MEMIGKYAALSEQEQPVLTLSASGAGTMSKAQPGRLFPKSISLREVSLRSAGFPVIPHSRAPHEHRGILKPLRVADTQTARQVVDLVV